MDDVFKIGLFLYHPHIFNIEKKNYCKLCSLTCIVFHYNYISYILFDFSLIAMFFSKR